MNNKSIRLIPCLLGVIYGGYLMYLRIKNPGTALLSRIENIAIVVRIVVGLYFEKPVIVIAGFGVKLAITRFSYVKSYIPWSAVEYIGLTKLLYSKSFNFFIIIGCLLVVILVSQESRELGGYIVASVCFVLSLVCWSLYLKTMLGLLSIGVWNVVNILFFASAAMCGPYVFGKTASSPSRTTDSDIFDEIFELKALADKGIITQEEFEEKKKELLSKAI